MINNSDKPLRCIDAAVKYCQGCPYGVIEYLEEYDDSFFEVHCMYGFEDDEPTPEELAIFEKYGD